MKKGIFDILQGDRGVWIPIFILGVFSLLAVYSSTGALAYKRFGGNTQYFLIRHFLFMLFSYGVMYFVHLIRYPILLRAGKVLFYISIPLLLYTLLGGVTLNQAPRWITIPVIKLSFQTSDLAKLGLMMYLAAKIANKQQNIEDFNKGFKGLIIPVLIVTALILPANLSTAALIFLSSIVLMYIGRVRVKHIFAVIGVGIAVLSVFILVMKVSNTKVRLGTWESRIETYIKGDSEGNFQSNQAKIAIANGGLTGRGLGHSVQRNILPHPYSDFIFAIIIEEGGFILALFIIFFYLIIFYRTTIIVKKCNRVGPALLVAGMMILMVLQAFVHMSVNVGLLPVTGQTLPFVSMGGSSLLISSVQMGIILSVSRSQKLEEANNKQVEPNNEVDENEQETEDID